jgi:hypothetical protein
MLARESSPSKTLKLSGGNSRGQSGRQAPASPAYCALSRTKARGKIPASKGSPLPSWAKSGEAKINAANIARKNFGIIAVYPVDYHGARRSYKY